MRLTCAAAPPGGHRAGDGSTGGGQRGLAVQAARLVAGLTRMTQDLGLAEDLAQDALVAALEQWPEQGVPRQPGCLADGGVQAPRDRPLPAGRAAAVGRRASLPERGRCPTSTPPSTTSRTTCCG